jgi:hypothetical protein
MEKKLQEFMCDDLLRPRISRDMPKWRVPPTNHRELAPPEGYVVSFVAFHEGGSGCRRADLCGSYSITIG